MGCAPQGRESSGHIAIHDFWMLNPSTSTCDSCKLREVAQRWHCGVAHQEQRTQWPCLSGAPSKQQSQSSKSVAPALYVQLQQPGNRCSQLC